ncbi:MAG: hypothetical protein J6T01_04875 [Kiritimatiellae bacterium]|nr:hypothetical protein [Kiritimatiellia bacterium]
MTLWMLALAAIVGDGIADDTAAIQERLDSGAACVYLPPPAAHYRISKTLRIGSNTELRLDRFSVVRLAPGSDCPMLENKCYRGGGTNRFVAVTGGIWDADNVSQTGNFMHLPELRAKIPEKFDPEWFIGIGMRFCHVENVTLRGVTIRNPVTYGIEFAKASYVTVDDVTFDYKKWNPIPLNLDGVHLDGFCHHFRITNLRGTCFDDMVALNANDGICSPEEGPITDVDIDGLYCEYCHSAARLLSAGAELKRVTIRNVHGNFYCYTVGLTHYFPQKPRGVMDDIVITDVFASKEFGPPSMDVWYRRRMPIIEVEGPNDIGNLTVERVYRNETRLPADTIGVDPKATVRRLTVRNCKMDNRTGKPIRFLGLDGKVSQVIAENNEFLPSRDAWLETEPRAEVKK